MIFKTLNGDLTVFNKTLISTKDHLKSLKTVNATVYNKNGAFNLQGLLVNSSQSVSTFTKLNNAFKAYNGNLSKSTQLQNAYVQAVGKQNNSLGNYLAGLNGAKASLGGYIKSLVAAKAASIGLQVASVALNTAISMGITLAISALVSQISKWIHAQEEARQKAIELTNAYKEQKDSLDAQIEKYKELKEKLDNGNLSTDETRSIKEQLLEIQKSLIESYGDEASNIDLVNGKYREQLGLLSELSKEKATDYVTENRDVFADAKEALEKIRTYNVGTVTSWNTYAPETEDQKKLIEYLETYSDLLDLTYSGASHGGVSATSVNLSVKANVANADELMHQLAEDLEKYGKDNNIDVSGLLEGISGQLKKTWTDELTDYKTVYDEFMKAEVIRNDTLRPLYQQSIQAVEDYNNALSSGEGVEDAKANLDSVQQSVQNATGELEGSQEVFDGIYDGINKNAEAAYQMSQSFENDESVKGYAEQLKGLTDIDLKAINFEDNVQSPGEEAFGALIDILGLSEDEVQNLIDKLVELGYVQGEVQDSTSNIENPISLFDQLTKSEESLDKFQSSVKSAADAYATLLTGNYSSTDLLDSIQAINKAASEMGKSINWEEIGSLNELSETIESVSQTYADSVLSGAGIDIDSKLGKMLANIVQEAYNSETALSSLNTQIDSLQSAYDSLTDIVETYNETGYVTFDQLQTLLAMEPQYLSCLIDENGQLQLNQEALTELANQRLNDARAQVIEQTITELGELAFKNEQTAIDNNKMSLTDNMETLTDYELRLTELIPTVGLATDEFVKLSNAIHGAMNDGASDDDIDKVIENAEKKLKLVNDTAANIAKGNPTFGKIVRPSSSGKTETSKKETTETSKKETTETFNWIETLLSRVQRTIKTLGNTVSSTWKSWTTRNSALTSELSEVRKEIELQKSAYDSYKAKADSINLSGHYKELIRNGALSIEDVTDDTLKEQIKEYKEYYEKALDCKDAVSELQDKLAELSKTKFDHISTQYDAKIQDIDHAVNLINGELEKAEELNQIAGNSFYEALISNENARIESLTNEYKEKLAAMNEAVSSGTIKRGSEAWQGMKSDIDSVTESIQDANNQILKYENSLKDIAKLKFDSLETQFDSALSIITTRMSQLDKQIALVEEAGYLAGESFYNAMIESEKTHTEALVKEYEALSSSLKEAMENGSVTKFDETWYDMTGSIHDVEDALLDAQTALIKYGNSLRELKWDVFDRTQESISGITQESDFLIDFMEKNNKLHNENGTFNDRGLSVQGLHAINYDVYLRQAEEYANAIKVINGELANDPNNTKLQDRYKELLNLQREAVLSAEDEKSAIKDLISEGYDKMLSFLDKLISARKKALSEEKSLHDYEKTIAEQTAEVAKYQKILDAYKGDDSEGMKATIQKAQESLTKAQEELNETEYDKYLSDQEALLDTFRTELEEWVNIRLDDINGLLQQAIEATNANAQAISGQINTDLTAVGMTLTESLAKIFEIDYSGGMKEIVSGFFGSDGNFSTAMTTVNTAIGEIKAKSDEIKVSTDQVSNILNQRFPELTQSMPSLTETNNKITDVTNAIGLVKEAITAIHTDMAKLELDLPDYGGNNDDNDDDNDNDWDNNWNDNTLPAPATPTAPPENNKTTASKPQATVTVTQKPKEEGPGHGDRPGLEVEAKYFYKNGVRKVPEDQLAETQEDGTEYILSPSRGGMITPLRKGDGVMTAEQSERLFQLSQLPPDELRNLLFPDYVPDPPLKNLFKQDMTTVNQNATSNNDVTVNITIPNITNKDEFREFLRSNESTRYIIEAVSDKYLDRNSYRRLRY